MLESARKGLKMLKIVVFDSGYGGEFFADQLAEALPIVEILRVINWREANKILSDVHAARHVAEASLRPYFGKVDLIIFANYLLSLSSLKYFKHKYQKQNFLGLELKTPDTFIKRDVLVLSTTAVSKTSNFRNFVFRLKRKTKILNLDTWPAKIDDGELTFLEIKTTLQTFLTKNPKFHPEEVILASAQFNDIKTDLKHFFGQNLRIYDGFDDAVRATCGILRIRGGKKKKHNMVK